MLTPGAVIDGRYQILAPLAAGGMGEVYRARRLLLGDEVAIKVMHAAPEAQSELRQRFLRESRTSAQLRHPNIVSILDYNVDSLGQPYLVMELLTGPSLRDEIEIGGVMSPARVADILTPVAAALQLAHDHGVTHRDLKPGNIVAHRYSSGERVYKVIDFGLAAVRESADTTRLTTPHVFMGTLAYAAPEQMAGGKADARADLYALGVIAYEMLTGRRPFDVSERQTLISQTLTDAPPEAGPRRSGLSEVLDAVLARALAKDPAERWPSANEFADALRAAVGKLSQTSAGTGLPVAAGDAAPSDVLLSRYELGELLGRGRLGSLVYLGTHRALGTPVAIRVLRRQDQPNWEAVKARFLIEARTLQVTHENLLQVRDFGEDSRLVYVVTDFVEGNSLREQLALEGKLPWSRVVTLMRQMLDATAVLNARGGFIAGVNPDMIRVARQGTAERIVLSTAGIRSVQDVLATMKEQELRGEEANEQELPYIAPEILMGRAPEPPADVFTIGVLAYQMLTASLPFRARTLPELIGQMLQTAPPAARSLNPDVPEQASALVSRCLVASPAQRVQSARDLLQQL